MFYLDQQGFLALQKKASWRSLDLFIGINCEKRSHT